MNDETSRFSPQDINANKNIACLSYLWILFLVPMVTKKDSEFCKFHVNQGLVFFLLTTICVPVNWFLNIIPLFGGILGTALRIILFAFFLMGVVFTLQGRAKRLPIIGNIQIYK